jgi:hypothetical protein
VDNGWRSNGRSNVRGGLPLEKDVEDVVNGGFELILCDVVVKSMSMSIPSMCLCRQRRVDAGLYSGAGSMSRDRAMAFGRDLELYCL